MKRSEMVNLMLKAYEEFTSAIAAASPDYPMPRLCPADVGFILKRMEQAGMLPPDHYVDGWDDMFGEPCKIRIRNSWEPEAK